jgi:hypothetical protein
VTIFRESTCQPRIRRLMSSHPPLHDPRPFDHSVLPLEPHAHEIVVDDDHLGYLYPLIRGLYLPVPPPRRLGEQPLPSWGSGLACAIMGDKKSDLYEVPQKDDSQPVNSMFNKGLMPRTINSRFIDTQLPAILYDSAWTLIDPISER